MFKGISFMHDHDFGSLHGYKVKGLVSLYVETSSTDDIVKIISTCKQDGLGFVPCGGGSNILIKDVFKGVFVQWVASNIHILQQNDDMVLVKVSSACEKSKLIEFCIKEGLAGLEFWSGIPGHVGGGVAMNAGAYGNESKGCVKEIYYVTEDGEKRITADNIKWAYRRVFLPDYAVITDVIFELQKKDKAVVKALCDSYVKDRQNKHPLEFPSCGSVFKNPNDYPHGAWWLIKEAGLSGYSVGGAKISEKHTNFIINSGNATANDIVQLIKEVKERVKEKFDVVLEEELRIY